MPEIEVTDLFWDLYVDLPKHIQKRILKALRFLAENHRHPSLRTKPIEGAPGIYEARVDRFYRMSYERLPGDVLRLRVVGNHDDVLKNP